MQKPLPYPRRPSAIQNLTFLKKNQPISSQRAHRHPHQLSFPSMGRSIVVAVDGGEESIHALTWCLQNIVSVGKMADEASSDDSVNGDTLVLLYARPSPSVYPAMDGSGYLFSSDIIASMDSYAKHLAKTVTEKAKMVCSNYPNLKVEIKVQNGDPRDVICEMVEKLGADMLVMGSHGYGPLKRAFIGSVSSFCAQNVKCPVLIVKKPKN